MVESFVQRAKQKQADTFERELCDPTISIIFIYYFHLSAPGSWPGSIPFGTVIAELCAYCSAEKPPDRRDQVPRVRGRQGPW